MVSWGENSHGGSTVYPQSCHCDQMDDTRSNRRLVHEALMNEKLRKQHNLIILNAFIKKYICDMDEKALYNDALKWARETAKRKFKKASLENLRVIKDGKKFTFRSNRRS
jgi:hypothetical protein